MKYLSKSFTVALGSDDYRANYDRVFGKPKRETPSKRLRRQMAELSRIAEEQYRQNMAAYRKDEKQ